MLRTSLEQFTLGSWSGALKMQGQMKMTDNVLANFE